MSKKSMISLLEAWEDQKDQYDTMKDFVDAFYASTKKSKKKKEEESEGSNEVDSKIETSHIKVVIKAPKEKKGKTRREKIVTEMGVDSNEVVKKPSKYLEFLKQWRVINPMIKGKEAIRQGAAAWRDFKTTLDV